MAGKRSEGDDRICCCDRAGGGCVGLAVRRLSRERVRELAEEIWTASTGRAAPAARPLPDPRGSRAGASAQAAYRRRREQEREAWRKGRPPRAAAVAAAAVGGGLLVGYTVGAWLGWPAALLLALLAGWRLRFRPSASAVVWRRQAAVQRRTARILEPLEREGYLLLHDVALPGWPASLDHLVVGPTGVWVIESWQRSRLTLTRNGTPLRGLRWEAAAIADAVAGGAWMPVRPLLCVHGGGRPRGPRSIEGLPMATPRQLLDLLRQGPPLQPGKVARATARALEALRPAV